MRFALLALLFWLFRNDVTIAENFYGSTASEDDKSHGSAYATQPRPADGDGARKSSSGTLETENRAAIMNKMPEENSSKVPPTHQKLSSIFPSANLPEDMKESWQQHLVEQFNTFRTEDVDDSLGTNADEEEKIRTTRRQLSNGRDVRFQGDFAFSGDDDVLDERTLLDVFGEAAKEFLTQRVVSYLNAMLKEFNIVQYRNC